MPELLSQEEINALTEAYKASNGAEDHPVTSDKQVRAYDFARPDKFCKEHLKALNLIHAKHGASLAISLTTMLRLDTQVSLLAIDQLAWKEYCASAPEGTLFAEVSLDPLTSFAVFEFNPSLVCACVDMLAGSPAVSKIAEAKISEIDKAVMRRVVDLALKKYAEAWSSSVAFKPKVNILTIESGTRQALLPSEAVLMCAYEVTLGSHSSLMSVCIPASAVEAVLPVLTLGRTLNVSDQHAIVVNEAVRKTFEQVEVECRGILGRTTLPLGDIAELEVGDLIRLPVRSDGCAERWVENVRAFAGTLGRAGRSLAIKVAQVMDDFRAKQHAA